jgi:RNA polymerase sigma-70 factor (ECF subfamily)
MDQRFDQLRARSEAPAAPYHPGVKADFDRLYRATYQRIFATLMLILRNPAAAEDATQEAYLRAFRAWGGWKQDAPAEAWIYRIALNVAFTQRRKERLHEIANVLRRIGRPKEPDPSEIVEADLRRELRALPPKQAAAIVLRHLHGFTNREIATALNVPERTVASRLAAAKTRLRSRLAVQGNLEMGNSLASIVPLEE